MRLLALFLVFLTVCVSTSAQEVVTVRVLMPAPLTAKDKDALARTEMYLNSLHTVSADFTQVSTGGDVTGGKFLLERPGKLRMEYAPPTPVLMVTDGSTIVYYDKELDQVSRISLDDTLVGFLAREKVRFDDSVKVTHVEHGEGSLRITLAQAKRPKDGALTLEFSDRPLALRNMIVTDSSGQTTTVSLSGAHFDVPLNKDLFVFHDPNPNRKNLKK
jgi:outer membrane lipoprotein-sorting protein